MVDDVSVRFGAQTQGVNAGVAEVKAQLTGLDAALAALRAAFAGVASSSAAAFASVEKGAAEARTAIIANAEAVKTFREGFSGIGEALLAAFAVHELIDFARKMGEAGEQVEHMSQRLGVGVEDVQSLRAAAVMSGSSLDQMGMAITRLDRAFASARQGSKVQVEAFKEIGVNIHQNYTQMQLLGATMEGFAKLADGPQKAAVALELLGRNGAALIPFLNLGKAGYEELNAAVERYGIRNKEAEDKAAGLGRSMNENKVAMLGLGNVMADAFAPVLKACVDGINDMIAAFIKSYKEGGAVKKICDILVIAVKAVVIVFMTLAEVIVQAWLVIKEVWDTMKAAWDDVVEVFKSGMAAVMASVGDMARAVGLAIAGDWADSAHYAVKAIGDAANAGMQHHAALQAAFKHTADVHNAAIDSMKAHMESYGNNVIKFLGFGAKTKGLGAASGGEGDTSGLGGGRGPKGPKPPDNLVELWRTAFQEIEDAHKGMITNETADEIVFWAGIKSSHNLTAKESEQIEKRLAQLRGQLRHQGLQDELTVNKQELADRNAIIADELTARRAAIEEERKDVDLAEKTGLISAKDAKNRRIELIEEERQAAADAADKKYQSSVIADEFIMAHSAATTEAYKNAQRDEVEANEARNRAIVAATLIADQKLRDLQRKTTEDLFSKWNNTFQQIGQSFASVTQGLLLRTMTWAHAFAQVGQQMLSMFLGWVFKMAAQWLAMEVTKTAATAAGTGTRNGLEVASAAIGLAAHAAAALAHIAMDAARAAAGAWAAVAGIPIIGPFLAPAMAAAALAGVLALGKAIFSAEGGFGKVPYDGALTALHKDEMVLPASIASPLRDQLGSGFRQPANDGGANDNVRDINIHLHGLIDRRGVQGFFRDNRSIMVETIREAVRGGERP